MITTLLETELRLRMMFNLEKLGCTCLEDLLVAPAFDEMRCSSLIEGKQYSIWCQPAPSSTISGVLYSKFFLPKTELSFLTSPPQQILYFLGQHGIAIESANRFHLTSFLFSKTKTSLSRNGNHKLELWFLFADDTTLGFQLLDTMDTRLNLRRPRSDLSAN